MRRAPVSRIGLCNQAKSGVALHIGEEFRGLIKVLLLERLSLRGICRVTGVALTWLLHFIGGVYYGFFATFALFAFPASLSAPSKTARS